jgi:hypothetical protein
MLRAMATIDEILATIRHLPLAERFRLIERATREATDDTPKAPAVAGEHRLSVDEFLAARLAPPPGVGTVSWQDMEAAIAQGANHV